MKLINSRPVKKKDAAEKFACKCVAKCQSSDFKTYMNVISTVSCNISNVYKIDNTSTSDVNLVSAMMKYVESCTLFSKNANKCDIQYVSDRTGGIKCIVDSKSGCPQRGED